MSQTPSNPPSPDEPQGQQQPPLPPQAPQQQGGGPGYGQTPGPHPQPPRAQAQPPRRPSGAQPGHGQQYPPQPQQPQAPQYPQQPPGPRPGQHGQPGLAPPAPVRPAGHGQQYAQQPQQVPGQPPYVQPEYAQQPQPSSGNNDILVAMSAHLTGFMIAFLGWIPPLTIYFAKRNTSPFVRHHGAEAANFQITMLIPYVFAGVLYVGLGIFFGNLAWIGSLLIALVWILSIVFGVLGASGANKGAWYRYPFSIRLLK